MIGPVWGRATVELIAVNAVMAGCWPEYFPTVIASVEAAVEPQLNLASLQTTTNPVGTLIVVNGPIRDAIGLNDAGNVFGPGSRANATIGRALRLVLLNVGGGRPQTVDQSTQGMPGKYTFCIAENEAASPWEPLHVERGFEREQSTVTVIGTAATNNVSETGDRAAEILSNLAMAMSAPGINDYLYGGEPLVVLCPEHARILAAEGWSKQKIKEYLFEHTKLPGRAFSRNNATLIQRWRPDEYGQWDGDVAVTQAKRPEDFLIVVAGGHGGHSCHLMSFGGTKAVTRPIKTS
jgi:hypothetical protein